MDVSADTNPTMNQVLWGPSFLRCDPTQVDAVEGTNYRISSKHQTLGPMGPKVRRKWVVGNQKSVRAQYLGPTL